MKIATFNANSIRARLPALLAWLAQQQPDIVCVQETKVQDHEFPRAEIEAAGYRAAYRGEKSYNGVAILARTPPASVSFGLDDGGARDETRLARADWPGLSVVNTYVPQGREIDHPMYSYKLEWFQRLRRYFERHFRKTDPVLWCGDLNVAAEAIDVHDPGAYGQHVCFHADVRAAFAACRAWGFEDLFRRFHPEGGRYSFFDYRTLRAVERNIGWRLDYLLATPPLARRVSACDIDLQPRRQEKPSDHAFVWADVQPS